MKTKGRGGTATICVPAMKMLQERIQHCPPKSPTAEALASDQGQHLRAVEGADVTLRGFLLDSWRDYSRMGDASRVESMMWWDHMGGKPRRQEAV